MAEYQPVTVDIVLKKGDDLYNRIQRYADAEGMSFDEAVMYLVALGQCSHIQANLDLIERLGKKN